MTSLSPPEAAARRFLIVQFSVLAAFVVVMVAVAKVVPISYKSWQRWLLTAGPMALLVVWAWEFVRMIGAQDEMMHALHLRAVAMSAGFVLFVAALWGIPERLLGATHLPAYLLLPAFAVVYSVVWAIIAGRR